MMDGNINNEAGTQMEAADSDNDGVNGSPVTVSEVQRTLIFTLIPHLFVVLSDSSFPE